MYEVLFLNLETMKEDTVLIYAEDIQEAKDILHAHFHDTNIQIKKIKTPEGDSL